MNADGPTLQSLVIDRKGDRSYEQLAMRSGGRLTRARIQQIATRPTKAFPDPETLTGLGLALGVPVQQVVLAAARSLGLDVQGPGDGDALAIPGGKRLTWTAQDALLTLARELPRAEERDEQQDDPGVEDQPQPDGVTTGERGGAAGANASNLPSGSPRGGADDTRVGRSSAGTMAYPRASEGSVDGRGTGPEAELLPAVEDGDHLGAQIARVKSTRRERRDLDT